MDKSVHYLYINIIKSFQLFINQMFKNELNLYNMSIINTYIN